MGLIAVEVTYYMELTVDELWPNGDAPKVIDSAAAREVIDQTERRRLVDEWGFPHPDVDVFLLGKVSNGPHGGCQEYGRHLHVVEDTDE